MRRGDKRFGVVQCSECGRFLQTELFYYSVVKRIKQLNNRLRAMRTVKTLCVECYQDVFGVEIDGS